MPTPDSWYAAAQAVLDREQKVVTASPLDQHDDACIWFCPTDPRDDCRLLHACAHPDHLR